jgi:membrane-associated protease RseP (regulator of RpoE activity)
MSDETPGDETTPDATPADDAPADEAPTTETQAAAAPQPAAEDPAERSGFFVPRWLAGVVAGLLLLGAGFGIGRATDSDHDDHESVRIEQGDRRSLPQLPQIPRPNGEDNGGNNGNNGGNGGNGDNTPQVPSGAFLGVAARDATGDQNGAEIVEVVNGGPADDAGLATGDVITKVDDTTVSSASDLGDAIQSHSSGDGITITYVHDGQSTDVKVTLGDRASGVPSSGSSSPSGSTN